MLGCLVPAAETNRHSEPLLRMGNSPANNLVFNHRIVKAPNGIPTPPFHLDSILSKKPRLPGKPQKKKKAHGGITRGSDNISGVLGDHDEQDDANSHPF